MNKLGYFLLNFGLIVSSCQTSEPKLFQDLKSTKSGVDFNNTITSTPELNILSYLYFYNGAGVAADDFNNDGKTDLYFTGNMQQDALYLQTDSLVFTDVLPHSQIDNATGWTTGVSVIDINQDGLKDIYISKASGFKALKGHNLLYVNQGNSEKGIPQFQEMSKKYKLDFEGLSTQAYFFDFDQDNDLDLFLLNHSVYPNRNYSNGEQRQSFDRLAGDRFYENQGGTYVDISSKVELFQGVSGYGLSASISDLNADGYPDIYVGNDFFENDYLYINQGGIHFKEINHQQAEKLGHTTHFSMGSVISDLNNDSKPDILSLDMLPNDLLDYKTSGQEYPYPIYTQNLKRGYSPQFMQNTFHLNLGSLEFSEIAQLSGIAATDWSWSVLDADFDLDGYKDLFVTNGIIGATNDLDYINFISNDQIQHQLDEGMDQQDLELIKKIPAKKKANYLFKNLDGLSFENTQNTWFDFKPSFAHGAIVADLNADGAPDLIVNNNSETAQILINQSKDHNSLEVTFDGPKGNLNGIGAKVWVFHEGHSQFRENFPHKSYLSSQPTSLLFGLGETQTIDSIKVVWPDQKTQTLTHQDKGKLRLSYKEAKSNHKPSLNQKLGDFSIVDYTHRENVVLDFNREPLLPFALSVEGPEIIVEDYNNDGLQDFFITGAKSQASALFTQLKGGSFAKDQQRFEAHALNEDTAAAFADLNGDGRLDLVVGSAGYEFNSGEAVQLRAYLQNKQQQFIYTPELLSSFEVEASKIVAADINNDGLVDLSITSSATAMNFGSATKHLLLKNTGTSFEPFPANFTSEIAKISSITDHAWIDIDANNTLDFISVGLFEAPQVLLNEGGTLKNCEQCIPSKLNGLWNTLYVSDLDDDGKLDILLGNWGANSILKASAEEPLTLYLNDFDNNGKTDALLTYYFEHKETLFSQKDEIIKQIPLLNKNRLSYDAFAKTALKDLLGTELQNALQRQVHTLYSGVLKQGEESKFQWVPFDKMGQIGPIFAIEKWNEDELFLGGNHTEINTLMARQDAIRGLFYNTKTQSISQRPLYQGALRSAKRTIINEKPYLLLGINNKALKTISVLE